MTNEAHADREGRRENATNAGTKVPTDLARVIDHTILKPSAGRDDVLKFCAEAREHHFFSVCVNPRWIPTVAAALVGSDAVACSVIGFPLGAIPPPLKAGEAAWVVEAGAREVDMVIDIGGLKDRQFDTVRADIAAVKKACGSALLKAIIETCLLTDEEKIIACRRSAEAGADYVKTSTGFSTAGAADADVALMRRTVGQALGVKAAGGVRTREDALKMLAAGASRIGASASLAIIAS